MRCTRTPRAAQSAADLTALGAAIAVYLAACAAARERWLSLLRHNGADRTARRRYALTAVGFMGNNVLPARGGDVLRALLITPRARTRTRGRSSARWSPSGCSTSSAAAASSSSSPSACCAASSVPYGGAPRVRRARSSRCCWRPARSPSLVLHPPRRLDAACWLPGPDGRRDAAPARAPRRRGARRSLLIWGPSGPRGGRSAEAAGLGVSVLETRLSAGPGSRLRADPVSGPGYRGHPRRCDHLRRQGAGPHGVRSAVLLLLLRFVCSSRSRSPASRCSIAALRRDLAPAGGGAAHEGRIVLGAGVAGLVVRAAA